MVNLSCDPFIIIKEEDKGDAIIISNGTNYLKEVEHHLQDHNFYTALRDDLTKYIMKIIRIVLQEL